MRLFFGACLVFLAHGLLVLALSLVARHEGFDATLLTIAAISMGMGGVDYMTVATSSGDEPSWKG